VDLVIAVGGDGTILHVASLFNGVRTLPFCVVDCIPSTKMLNCCAAYAGGPADPGLLQGHARVSHSFPYVFRSSCGGRE
jgi:hypothetical protein